MVDENARLLATHCQRCGRTFFPPKRICPNCFIEEGIESVELSRRGQTYSVAIQRMVPIGKEPGPNVVCYVDLEMSGVRLFGRLDCAPEEARIGMPVEVVVDGESTPDGFLPYHFRKRGQGSRP